MVDGSETERLRGLEFVSAGLVRVGADRCVRPTVALGAAAYLCLEAESNDATPGWTQRSTPTRRTAGPWPTPGRVCHYTVRAFTRCHDRRSVVHSRVGAMRQFSHQLSVSTRGKGFYEITSDVGAWVGGLGIDEGLLTVFLQHTSASLV